MLFIIWMLFFDSNSWLVHRELNKKVYKLENQKDFYSEGIKKDKEELLKMKTDSGLIQVVKILKGIDGIGFVNLTESDVVRHKLVKDIILAYDKSIKPKN